MEPLCFTCGSSLENYFAVYRKNILGYQQKFDSPAGEQTLLYADWTASGRAYGPIERHLQEEILPFIGNTHTNTTVTGTRMSVAYAQAKQIIKSHVNAGEQDALLFCGSGMTSAVNKLQRMLGLRAPCEEEERPVVFVTHMEHHSNHLSWLETNAIVEIIDADENGNVSLHHLRSLLEQFKHCRNKMAAVTACSNVTGIYTPYHDIAALMHQYGGRCFVDFACAAPYCTIDMHPALEDACLDAIYFSPHKFLGGPGTPGVLIFNKKMYQSGVPDHPGGGTVLYSNPWRDRIYTADIEQREDGGTPPFLQGIKAAMCIRLKEAMGLDNILQREAELLEIIFERAATIPGLHLLEPHATQRAGVVSFIVDGVPYPLIVKLLNDKFGIQVRGGCSCAGTYGHWLLEVDKSSSYAIRTAILSGDLSCKPGWVRLSVHPVMTNAEIHFIMDAIETTIAYAAAWAEDYVYDASSNEYYFKAATDNGQLVIERWFDPATW
ncbi:MAG: aminotransferase class V-fold PLP-dependent enzyme [Chitinophaga sp.]|uniref:aminotransferase class V-fold PLP-dependent enzyme n=1 Tax=Chitinophaga sp. TaxID=1869181 RepID=UPI001B141035|nr:aminotransferase class V-fold PLP-dependent enzyme [Chitinophaga sp.]MBO9730681.1 aminotransferase class V-fold PLP-dependent enzyme [Chitinophaga sp.]